LSDGATRRQVRVLAADLLKLAEAVVKAKERFGMPNSARVVSCYHFVSIMGLRVPEWVILA